MIRFLNELKDLLLIYATSIFDSKASLTHKKLEIAIKYSNISYLKKLVQTENIKNIDEALLHKNSDKTILMLACEEGNIASVKVLLDNNADPNALFKGSGLYYACLSGNMDLIKYMISRVIDIDDEIIFNCLFKSTHSKILNNMALVMLLLSHVRDINYVTNDGTLLRYACKAGLSGIVTYLMEYGADRSAVNWLGMDALYIASEWGHVDVVKALVEWGGGEPIAMSSINAALRAACKSNRLEVAAYLIERGADVNLADERGDCPLVFAVDCYSDTTAIVQLIVSKGADVHVLTSSGEGLLSIAHAPAVVRLLAGYGVKATAAQSSFNSTLSYICSKYNTEYNQFYSNNNNNTWIPELIHVKEGENIDYTYDIYATPQALLTATVYEIEVLIIKGADVNMLFDDKPLLLWAVGEYARVKGCDIMFVAWLLDHGAEVNIADPHTGETPLMIAATAEHIDLVKLLLERGADVSQLNHAGQGVLGMLDTRGWGLNRHDIVLLCKQYIDINKPGEMKLLLK